jgi:hypothetical protein
MDAECWKLDRIFHLYSRNLSFTTDFYFAVLQARPTIYNRFRKNIPGHVHFTSFVGDCAAIKFIVRKGIICKSFT